MVSHAKAWHRGKLWGELTEGEGNIVAARAGVIAHEIIRTGRSAETGQTDDHSLLRDVLAAEPRLRGESSLGTAPSRRWPNCASMVCAPHDSAIGQVLVPTSLAAHRSLTCSA